jgi:polyhydroxyalkanoate synthesis repressor PhaR
MPSNGQIEQEPEAPPASARQRARPEGPITIKKYANRRLYNTATSSYVTLDHLAEMVKGGQDFVVFDAKTGEDITRSVLTQIIFEMEGKGQNMLPIRFLRQLIRFYGDSVQAFVPGYLDMSMESFVRNQEEMRRHITQAFGGGTAAFKGFEDQVRSNMALFERTMRMFSPFSALGGRSTEGERALGGPGRDEELETLKSQVESMQRQLNQIADKK